MVTVECFHQDIVQNKHLLWMCKLILSYIIAAAADSEEKLSGYVGGKVVFRCPLKPDVKYKFLYLQRDSVFVNGYYESKNMSTHNPWPNTKLEKEKSLIYMSELNVSHAGQYTCYFETSEGLNNVTHIELTITANYSKPSIQLHNCTKEQCLVQCSSHGGYPNKTIEWGKSIVSILGNDHFEDNKTQLFNLSSMASFNCSTGKQQNISCSVDGVSSVLSVCKQENIPVTVACIVVPILAVLLLAFGIFAYKKFRSRARPYTETNQNEDESGL
ncbi:uncharacterized protein LOC110174404 [Boleophthalmus pectinirostris]|uniref:uncharacterized protein LOC110174404 n=1 Tax=Boleophthalmus pectinirostris TaxID=150288 RepID=UPI00242FAA8F|nr:uncharacterized protein LOC110174404 [Boleophthalmus pectinirostris]